MPYHEGSHLFTGGGRPANSPYGGSEPDADQTYQWQPIDRSGYDQYTGKQLGVAEGYYGRLAQGQDSYGEAQMNRGLGQAQRGMAAAAVSRGANPAAERAAMMGGAQMQAQAVGDAAALRAQEMQAATGQYLDTLGSARQGELSWADQERQRQEAAARHYAEMVNADLQETQQDRALVGTVIGGAGALMASDRRLKEAIARVSPQAQDEIARSLAAPALSAERPAFAGSALTPQEVEIARSALGTPPAASGLSESYGRPSTPEDELSRSLALKSYRYNGRGRELGAPAGERLGLMAQDLERTDLGRRAVVETPQGKAIDRDNALGLSLALHGRDAERNDAQDQRIARIMAELEASDRSGAWRR